MTVLPQSPLTQRSKSSESQRTTTLPVASSVLQTVDME